MTVETARTGHILKNVKTGFVALKKPFEGKHGAAYAISLVFDIAEDGEENAEILAYIAKVLTKGGPVDIKDGLKSTGKFKLSFTSKDAPIPVFDAKGVQIPQDQIPNLGEGSKVNVKFRVVQTKRGVFKYIDGVQIVEVKEYVAQKPKVAFDAVDGFEHKEVKGPKKADFDSLFN